MIICRVLFHDISVKKGERKYKKMLFIPQYNAAFREIDPFITYFLVTLFDCEKNVVFKKHKNQ